MGSTEVGNRKISLNDLRRFCEAHCDLNFRNNVHFKRYAKGWSRLKRLMGEKNLTKEQALSVLEEKIRRKAIECLYKAINAGTYTVIYGNLPCYRQWYFAWLIDHLIRKGFIKAYYTGPSAEELKKNDKCGARGLPNDPWLGNRMRSAEIKIWSFYTTGNETRREKRLDCWARYIKLDLTGLINALRPIKGSTTDIKLISNAEASNKENNTYQGAKSDSDVEESFKKRILAPDASVVDSIEKRADGIMDISTDESNESHPASGNAKSPPKSGSGHKSNRNNKRGNK